MSTQPTYKAGDIYPDWAKLQRLTENDTVNKGALIVRICDSGDNLKEGTICEASETSYENNRTVSVNGNGWDKWRFALLPDFVHVAKQKTDEKFRRVWTQHQTVTHGVPTVQKCTSNDDISVEKEWVKIGTSAYKIEEAQHLARALAVAIKQHKAAFSV